MVEKLALSNVMPKNNIISPCALSKMYAIKESHPNSATAENNFQNASYYVIQER